MLWVYIPLPCWCLDVVSWPRTLCLCCWASCTLSYDWLCLHWVIPGLALLFLVDVTCLIWDSEVHCQEPHFSHCIQSKQHGSFCFYNMKNKSPVLVIPSAKNVLYPMLLDGVGIVIFWYGSILTMTINGLTLFIKLWRVYIFICW